MANDNYIGIAMGLDVSDLKSGLSEANKQIQLANSEFKAASSEMEDWTKSTDGLKAKITQLSKVFDLQNRKLQGLQAEYDKVVASQGENSEQARKLKVQINNQKSVVNATSRELGNYEKTLKDAEAGTLDLANASLKSGKAISSVGDSAKDSSSKLSSLKSVGSGVAKGIAVVASAVVGLASAFLSTASSTREFRNNMSKLETGFTQAGLTAEDATNSYNTLYGVVGDIGKATEASSMLAQLVNDEKELTEWTDILTGVYATYGDALPIEGLAEASNETAKTGKITGVLADALNWAGVSEDEFQAKLNATTSEQERQALITETLNGLYGESAEKFKELNKDIIEAQEADAKLSQAMAELGKVAEPILTTLKNLASDLLQEIMPFVDVFGEGLNGALNGVSGSAEKIAQGLSGLIDTILNKVVELLPTIVNVVLELIPMLVNTILEALPQLLDVVIQIVDNIINLLGEILPTIIEKIIEIVPVLIVKLLDYIPQLIQSAITLLMSIVKAIPIVIQSLLTALPTIVDAIINALILGIPALINGAIQLFNAIIQAIPVIIQSLVVALPTIIDAIINGLLSAIPVVLDSAITLLFAIIDAIPTIVVILTQNMPKIITSILSSLVKAIPNVLSTAIELFMGIVKAIPKIIIELVKNIPQIIVSIVSGLIDGVKDLYNVGVELFNGLWEGIKDTWNKITKWLNNAWESLTDNLKKFFGIHSPSKLMMKMGGYIGEGLGEGIKDSIPTIKKDLSAVNNFVADNLGNVKASLSNSSNALNGASSQVVNAGLTINYNGNLSRKQVRKLEDDYYRSVKLRLKSEGAI
ncbi:MAG: hypothetical protein SPJ27_04630 [Candidatus Onthovivens sp.]|nr:hypothetical protein [Candidatus Onthovivens sp.]